MVISCCVVSCKEYFKKGRPVTFHCFPKDPVRRKLWERKIPRVNFKVTDHARICSKHFTPDSFDLNKFGGTWLKPDANPTIFDFETSETTISNAMKQKISNDKNLQEDSSTMAKSEKSCHGDFNQTDANSPTKGQKLLQATNIPNPMKRKISADESLHEDSSTMAKKDKRLHYFGDFDLNDVISPTKAQKFMEVSQAEVLNCNRTIGKLRQENMRLKRRVASLNRILNKLKEEEIISDDASSVLKLSLPRDAEDLINQLESKNKVKSVFLQ